MMMGLAPKLGAFAIGVVIVVIPVLILLQNFRAAFLLFIAVIPNLGEIEHHPYHPLLWLVGFAPLLIAWIFAWLYRPQQIVIPLLPAFLFFIFIVAGIASHFGSLDLLITRLNADGRNSPYWQVADFFVSVTVGLIAMTAYRNEADLRKIFLAFIISGIPYAITIFLFGKEMSSLGVVEEDGRHKGFYGHEHMASTHMIVCAILAASYAGYASSRRVRYFCLGATLLYLSTLAYASSRTTVAAIPVVVFIWAAMELGGRRAIAITAALVLLPTLAYPLFPDTIQRDMQAIAKAAVGGDTEPRSTTLPGDGPLNTFKDRVIQVKEGVRLIKERPWAGHGPGTVAIASTVHARFSGPQIHNYYVQTYVELGLIGGTILLTLVLTVMTLGYINTVSLGHLPIRHLVRGLFLAALMVEMVIMLNSGSVGLRIIWCLLGLVAGTGNLLLRNDRAGGLGGLGGNQV